ncbi:MAG: hypothetical protein JRF53_00660 [Deltaproteobacteria bacterium]|nr:hypothetical protein [Deltaproteobacteria bacterium]
MTECLSQRHREHGDSDNHIRMIPKDDLLLCVKDAVIMRDKDCGRLVCLPGRDVKVMADAVAVTEGVYKAARDQAVRRVQQESLFY